MAFAITRAYNLDLVLSTEAELKVAVMEKLEELKKRLSSDMNNFTSSQASTAASETCAKHSINVICLFFVQHCNMVQ